MICKFRGKALFTDKKQGVKKGDWVKGYLYIKEEKKRRRYFILRDIEIRLEPNFAWDYGDGPGEEDFYIHGMIEVIPETVGMWVGLIDKNNEEIYEGDILSWKYAGMEEEFFFVEDIFSVYREKVKYAKRHMDDWHLPSIAKVIGNKWDNPGLLKGRKEDYHGKKA